MINQRKIGLIVGVANHLSMTYQMIEVCCQFVKSKELGE